MLKHFLGILVFLSAVSCKTSDLLYEYKIEGRAQGTTYAIKFYATDSLQVTKPMVELLLDSLNESLSLYKEGSLINSFNASDKGVVMDDMLRTVVKRAMEITKDTEGLSDITVQPLVAFWGFGTKRIESEPDTTELPAIMNCVGSHLVYIKGDSLLKKKPCVKIDLNGIAQGYSVDRIASMIERKGIENYIVEVGGEIRVKGRKKPSDQMMDIGIESPADFEDDEMVLNKIITTDNGAVTTSGNYHKYYESHGKIITHLIDPRSGRSMSNELISVTVYAPDAMTADGYDHALMGMGIKQGLDFAEKSPTLEAYFIYSRADGTIADTATKGFYKLIKRKK